MPDQNTELKFLIEIMEAGKSSVKNSISMARNGAIDYCIDIVRQHQAEKPSIQKLYTSQECIQKDDENEYIRTLQNSFPGYCQYCGEKGGYFADPSKQYEHEAGCDKQLEIPVVEKSAPRSGEECKRLRRLDIRKRGWKILVFIFKNAF